MNSLLTAITDGTESKETAKITRFLRNIIVRAPIRDTRSRRVRNWVMLFGSALGNFFLPVAGSTVAETKDYDYLISMFLYSCIYINGLSSLGLPSPINRTLFFSQNTSFVCKLMTSLLQFTISPGYTL